ncbi:MAG: hypothetical protein AB7G17_08835 [Phycisphaerales bacterium]
MFVKFVDKKGRDVWVNPIHVKALTPAGSQHTDLHFSYSAWGTGSYLRVQNTPDQIALTLDAAMPPISFYPDTTDEEAANQRAVIAASTGVVT